MKRHQRSALTMGLITMGLVIVSCATEPVDPGLQDRIARIESEIFEFRPGPADEATPRASGTLAERMANYKIPGVSIAVVEAGEIDWVKGYGVIKVDGEDAVSPDTRFEAASTSKLVVAAIVLHYVQEGLLDLDEDVNAHLRSWKLPESPLTAEKKVTLRLLLTHRAGLNRPDSMFDWDGEPTLVQTLMGEAPAKNDPAVVEFPVDDAVNYSNFGYLVIQLLLEDVFEKPFIEIAQEVVFEPLAMKSSAFEGPPVEGLSHLHAYPHDPEGVAHEFSMHPTSVANGGLVTTPRDLAIFTNELIAAHRGESDRILSQETAHLMFEPEVDLGAAMLGFPMSEGLGALIRGEGESLCFFHPGDNYPGASCWLLGFPAASQGAVIMTNGALGNMLAMELIEALGKEYGWPQLD